MVLKLFPKSILIAGERTRSRRGTVVMRRVHVLPCGHELDDKCVLTLLKGCGTKIKLPYYAYLIEDPECTVLVDTGLSIRWKELHPKVIQELFPTHMEEQEHLDRLLESMGFSRSDVDYVINTHLHYDHCGNNEMFPQATFLVSESELAHAFAPGWWEAPSYLRSVFDIPGLKYELVKEGFEIVRGVGITSTPGHSEGHQSVVVELDNTGTLVIAGDAISTRENLEDPILPGFYVDARQYAHSMDRLKGIIELHEGVLLPSHSREYLTKDGWKEFTDGVQSFT